VPPEFDDSEGPWPDPDWPALFAHAGLDPKRFEPVDPHWVPPRYCDVRTAWAGSYGGDSDFGLRVEAGAYRGRPVYFRLVEEWRQPQQEREQQETSGTAVALLAFYMVMSSVPLVATVWLAYRNLRRGRGDRRGAWRIAAFVFSAGMVSWLLAGHHVLSLDGELSLIRRCVYGVLAGAGVAWLLYMAIEPHVRRLYPGGLISWNRLLAGRVRDPRIGRDLLVGALFGVGVPLLLLLRDRLAAGLGLPPELVDLGGVHQMTLAGWRTVAADFLSGAVLALQFTMLFLIFLVLLRAVLRKGWLAGAAFVVVMAAIGGLAGPNPLLDSLSMGLRYAIPVVVLLRFGLLAAIASTFVEGLLTHYPITTDLSAWYAGGGLFGMLAVLALAAYGFHTSLAGQPLVADKLLEE
jgi:hypothetical protein